MWESIDWFLDWWNWQIAYYIVSFVFLTLSAFVIIFNDKTRGWIRDNVLNTMFRKSRSIGRKLSGMYWWIVRSIFVWYKYHVKYSEYKIPISSSEEIIPALIWFAHRRRMSKRTVDKIYQDPIRSLRFIGLKTEKEGTNFRIKDTTRCISSSKKDTNVISLFTRINYLLGEKGKRNEIELAPGRYVLGSFRKDYSQPGRFPIGVISYSEYIRGGEWGTDYHERKEDIELGKPLLPYKNEIDFIKEVRVMVMVEKSKKVLNIRGLKKIIPQIENSEATGEFIVKFESNPVYLKKTDISADFLAKNNGKENDFIEKCAIEFLRSLPEKLGRKHDPDRKVYPFTRRSHKAQKSLMENITFGKFVKITTVEGSVLNGIVETDEMRKIEEDKDFILVKLNQGRHPKSKKNQIRYQNISSIEFDSD